MEILIEYHIWIMVAALLGLILLPQKQKKKKSVLTLITVLAFSIGYELVMGEPVTEMPSRVNQYFHRRYPSWWEPICKRWRLPQIKLKSSVIRA